MIRPLSYGVRKQQKSWEVHIIPNCPCLKIFLNGSMTDCSKIKLYLLKWAWSLTTRWTSPTNFLRAEIRLQEVWMTTAADFFLEKFFLATLILSIDWSRTTRFRSFWYWFLACQAFQFFWMTIAALSRLWRRFRNFLLIEKRFQFFWMTTEASVRFRSSTISRKCFRSRVIRQRRWRTTAARLQRSRWRSSTFRR